METNTKLRLSLRPDLTIEQVKDMKQALSKAIHKLVHEFQTTTGVHVDISVDRTMTIGAEPCDYPFEIRISGHF